MAQSSWPDPANGRVVTERQYELLAARFSDNGLYWQPGDAAPIYADGTGGRVVKVRADIYGSVRGYGWQSGSTGDTLAVAANATGATRQDRVVLRLTRADWTVRMAVKTGGTTLPPLTRDTGDSGVFEEHVAAVAVPNGATSLTAGTVTARPTAVGSRIRPQYSTDRTPNPNLGDIAFDSDLGQWIGWSGSAWKLIGTEDSGDVAITRGAKWRADGPNLVRSVGSTVSIDLNLLFGEALNEVISRGSVNDLLVATIPAAFRPSRYKFFLVSTGGAGETVRLQVQTDGKITAFQASDDLNWNQALRATLTYIR